jgi:hypothetical protein
MKDVPPHIAALGPPGTQWSGGSVDRSRMVLRVMSKERRGTIDKDEVARLLACKSDREKWSHWCLHAPESEDAHLDDQVAWILSRVTSDLTVWQKITSEYRVDLFCGLFLERPNRGVTLSVRSMADLATRNIELGFDIYIES